MSIDQIVHEITQIMGYVNDNGWDSTSGDSIHEIMVYIMASDLSGEDRDKITDALLDSRA
jgi:hypothetical protein